MQCYTIPDPVTYAFLGPLVGACARGLFNSVGLTLMEPELFYYIGAAFAVMCIVITWVRYARPGAPTPS